MGKEKIVGNVERKYQFSALEITKKLKLTGEIKLISQMEDGDYEIQTVEKRGT